VELGRAKSVDKRTIRGHVCEPQMSEQRLASGVTRASDWKVDLLK
jgi:hypothetical protein